MNWHQVSANLLRISVYCDAVTEAKKQCKTVLTGTHTLRLVQGFDFFFSHSFLSVAVLHTMAKSNWEKKDIV